MPGRDFAGVVVSAPEGSGFQPGDAVFGVCNPVHEGAYAERIAIAPGHIAHTPAGVGHIEAAAMALAGLTAMIALEETLAVRAGEKLLVQGGAGGVGTMALQLGRHIGAHVGATARSENHDYLRQHGAEVCVDYRTADLTEVFGGCDAVFDCVGPATLASTFAALKPGGRAAFIGMGRTTPEPPDPRLIALRPNVIRDRARMDRLAGHIRDGIFHPPEIRVMPLAEAAEAHRIGDTGHVRGKIVFEI